MTSTPKDLIASLRERLASTPDASPTPEELTYLLALAEQGTNAHALTTYLERTDEAEQALEGAKALLPPDFDPTSSFPDDLTDATLSLIREAEHHLRDCRGKLYIASRQFRWSAHFALEQFKRLTS